MKKNITAYSKGLFILSVIIIAGFCHSCGRADEAVELRISELQESATEPPASFADTEEIPAGKKARCYVHVCGEVRSPGVYEMESGARIYEAIEQAGGYTEAAATDYLNLAETVSDGMKIVVPDRETLLSESEGNRYGFAHLQENISAQETRINLNTASREQLMTLRGIGEARAGDIIRYREERGKFQTIEEIMNVSGIKAAAFEKIKDDITV